MKVNQYFIIDYFKMEADVNDKLELELSKNNTCSILVRRYPNGEYACVKFLKGNKEEFYEGCNIGRIYPSFSEYLKAYINFFRKKKYS